MIKVLLIVVLLYLFYTRFLDLALRMYYYHKQGVPFCSNFPMITDLTELLKCAEEDPNKFVISGLIDKRFGDKKPSMCFLCLPNNYNLVFNSVKLSEEAFVKKNSLMTKENTIRKDFS